jgi:hypothetical protein
MYAVVRLAQDLGDRWHVLTVSSPMHQRLILQTASQLAQDYRIDPRMIDAVYNYPHVPMTIMHAFWCMPDKVLDIRPVDPVSLVRHYRLDGHGSIDCRDEEREVPAYLAQTYAPLSKLTTLEPYGTERFFRPKEEQ